MDVIYTPPKQDEDQCGFLRRNMLICLKEKFLKDQIPEMRCNVQLLLWFNLECPDVYNEFRDPKRIRQTFIFEKQLDTQPKPPSYIRLGWKVDSE